MGVERGESCPSSRVHQPENENQHKLRDGMIMFAIVFVYVALIAAFFYFPFQIDEPICFISSFNIASTLNQISNHNATSNNYNSTIKIPFTVGFLNKNVAYGLTYSDTDFTISVFVDKNLTRHVGRLTIPSIYVPLGDIPRNSVVLLKSSIETRGGALNGTAKLGGKMYFRMDFNASVKYDALSIYVKRKRVWGAAIVAVNDYGITDDEIYIPFGHSPLVIE